MSESNGGDAGSSNRARAKARLRRLLSAALAAVALAFVVTVVPIRDRCVSPVTGARIVRVDESTGCRLEPPKEAALHLSPAACASLQCEPGLGSLVARARPGWLVAMLALYFFGTLAWALRWRELLELAKLRLSRGHVWRVTLEAQAGGILLPGGVAGDALRIGAMVGMGVPAPTVVASVLLDRVIGLVTLASVAGALALSGGALGTTLGNDVALTLASLPIGLVVGLVAVRSAPVARFLSRGRLARITKDPVAYINDTRALGAIVRATALSVVVSATQLLVVRGLVEALGGGASEPRWLYLGGAMAFMVGALPLLPGGWGTSDAAFVFFFSYAGVSPQAALGVSLFYRAFWYVSGIVGALLRLARPSSAGAPP